MKPKLSIYILHSDKCEQICSNDLPGTNYNSLIWAPDGQYFVLAAVGQSGGEMLFCMVTPNNKFEVLHKEEHFMLTNVYWSPCSRYVLTCVIQDMRDKSGGFRMSAEAGYKIWTVQGRILFAQQKEKLYSCMWRPHPPFLLEDKRQEQIRRGLKQFSKRYDARDEHDKDEARTQFRRQRETKMNAFNEVFS